MKRATMHDAAFKFYQSKLSHLPALDVLEFGSYNINGSVRDAYPQAASWWGIDIAEGNGVDQVADSTTYRDGKKYDIVICAEVFEHTPAWKEIIYTAWVHLKKGGLFLASCASRDRPPHSAFDGGAVREGEYYANISPEEMINHLTVAWDPDSEWEVIPADGYFGNDDLYLYAYK